MDFQQKFTIVFFIRTLYNEFNLCKFGIIINDIKF